MITKSRRPGSKKHGNRDLGRMMFDARRRLKPVFSAKAMGKTLQVSKDTVERWEAGKIMPTLDQLEGYCRALVRRNLDEKLVVDIFKRAYPHRSFDPRPRLDLERDRTNRGDADQRPMILPPDAEGIAAQYWSDPIPEAIRNDTIERLSVHLRQDGWCVEKMEKGQGCTCPAFNLQLIVGPPSLRLRVLQERWVAYQRYSQNLRIYALVQAYKGPGDIDNWKKIRIASDFVETGTSEVAIQETDYLSSIMTDQLAWKRILSTRLGPDGPVAVEVLWDGISSFVDDDPGNRKSRLKGFAEATISNQLAASTLAFSSDGYLMIVAQNVLNQQSANYLAPTGSGSLDWADVEKIQSSDLLSLVRFGAERELREEAALDEDGSGRRRIGSKVMVTGFTRMLHRGGKPEFFCLGRIYAPSKEICDRKPERYVERVVVAEVPSASWKGARPKDGIIRACMDYLEKRRIDRREGRIPLSYPLEQGLKLLIEACADERAAAIIDQFMLDELH